MPRFPSCLLAAVLYVLAAQAATAQGLVWSVPETEGRWIRYAGDYTQVMKRPDDPMGDLTLTWRREVTIKALQAEEAMIDGQSVPCRWIELKTVTGPVKEGIIDAGPGGVRLYKVLVPLAALQGVHVDEQGHVINADGVAAAHFPIAKGYRKIGNETATPLDTSALTFYPALSLLQNYKSMTVVGMEDVPVGNANVPATHYKGEMVTEDPFTRSTNVGEIWRTDAPEVPFGIAKWLVTLSIEGKDSTAPRSEFQLVSVITEEMSAVEVGDGEQSELVIE
jgi:hypothetical protein